ncbi:MAG: hypothetical protein NZ659_01095 [Acidimicrobiales bacterium]|nr:hypothetical protein [Acidimicrobiales bacterium]
MNSMSTAALNAAWCWLLNASKFSGTSKFGGGSVVVVGGAVVAGAAVAVVGAAVAVGAAVVGGTESSDSTDVVGPGDAVVGLVVSFVVGDDEFPQAAVRSRKARKIVNFLIAGAY